MPNGIRGPVFSILPHEGSEGGEEVSGVVGAGGRFGVKLDAERRLAFMPNPFDCAVVEIDMR